MKLNFKDKYYLDQAIEYANTNELIKHSILETFMKLLQGVKIDDLYNLCRYLETYYIDQNLTFMDCYLLTQDINVKNIPNFKECQRMIYLLAYNCLENNNYLGKTETSAWLGHSLFVALVAGELANILNLDRKLAIKMGLIHDIGRKQTHTPEHITRGFENLVDAKWGSEALSCLTHSFIKGGRYLNDELEKEDNNSSKDDINIFLEKYNYNTYDYVINLADLMATSFGVVAPFDRIKDVFERRNLDVAKNLDFLVNITNFLIEILQKMGVIIPKNIDGWQNNIEINDIYLANIIETFYETSDLFYKEYKKRVKQKI